MIRTWLLPCALLFASTVGADLQLRVEDGRSGVSTISSNGRVARIDTAAREQYVIIGFQRNEAQVIEPARGEVAVSRFGDTDAGVGAEPIAISLEDRGKGPRIAADPFRVPAGMAQIDLDRLIGQAMQHGQQMMKVCPI